MEKRYRAAKYIRTSCPDDKTQYRDSVANQSRVIDGFLRTRPEISVVTERIDESYSGLFFDRPAFREMIEDIKTERVNCVIVKDLSRLGRSYIDTGICFRDIFQVYNVRFISVNDNIDSVCLDGIERIFFLIKNIFNEQYCHDVSVKTRRSLEAKRKHGQYIGAVPIYGYQRSADNKYKLTIDRNTYTIVQNIFQMKLAGLSAARIAAELNKSAIPSPLVYKQTQGIAFPTGGFADKPNACWSATTVLRILQDENYTGTLVQGRQRYSSFKSKYLLNLPESEWNKTEDAHPPIVSKFDFYAVRRVLALDTRTPPNCDKVHIFSGLLTCGYCGGSMARKTSEYSGKHYVYYSCAKCKRVRGNLIHTISENDLLHIVTTEIKERIRNINKLILHFSEEELTAMAQASNVEQIALYSKVMQDMQTFRTHLYSSLADNLINTSEFQAYQKYYDKEIARLDVEMSALQKKVYSAEESLMTELNWADIFMQYRDVESFDRTAVVKMVRKIKIINSHEVIVEFICRQEYEQLVCLYETRGGADGEKKS